MVGEDFESWDANELHIMRIREVSSIVLSCPRVETYLRQFWV